jgi:NTP pyrophosphatase (non-canonical NTP hydrolase)
MAQFKIDIPEDFQKQLVQRVIDVKGKQAANTLPEYETFVMNLMKTLPTAAEELHHAGTGIAGEGGEILDITKKVWVYGKPLDIAHMIEELGDLRFYYQAMLNLLQLTDEVIVASNMDKLSIRYADGKYSDAQANARADKAPTPAPPVPDAERKFFGQLTNIHDKFDQVRNANLRQLRKDEQQ